MPCGLTYIPTFYETQEPAYLACRHGSPQKGASWRLYFPRIPYVGSDVQCTLRGLESRILSTVYWIPEDGGSSTSFLLKIDCPSIGSNALPLLIRGANLSGPLLPRLNDAPCTT